MLDIINENKNLIYKIANIYKSYASIEDLFQAGCIGIIEAYKKYDSKRNVKFTTFAYPYILGEINKCVVKNEPIKVSRDLIYMRKKIDKVKNILAQEYKRMPTDIEIANYLDVDIDYYNDVVGSINCVSSLDYSYDDLNLYDVIGSSMDIDDIIMFKMELDKLDSVDKEIILSHFMYDLTQSEIANNMGMNQVAVSRKEAKVLTRIRSNLK